MNKTYLDETLKNPNEKEAKSAFFEKLKKIKNYTFYDHMLNNYMEKYKENYEEGLLFSDDEHNLVTQKLLENLDYKHSGNNNLIRGNIKTLKEYDPLKAPKENNLKENYYTKDFEAIENLLEFLKGNPLDDVPNAEIYKK